MEANDEKDGLFFNVGSKIDSRRLNVLNLLQDFHMPNPRAVQDSIVAAYD